MGFDLLGNRRLLLAGTGLGWLWILAGAIALVLLLVLYREERRLISRRAGLGLLGLRITAATVLVLALFEPIATRTYHETLKGRVIVAVDVSASMETTDPGRSPADHKTLARVLGLSPGEPVESLTRREVAQRLLNAKGSPIETIEAAHTTEVVAFAREATPTTRARLAKSLKQPGKADDPTRLTTDWQPVLAEALRTDDAPVLGVILLTDGRQNAQGDGRTSSMADRLAAQKIPVYPVLIGSMVPPRDAAIATVRAPRVVSTGDVAHIEATLKLDGYAGREVAVTLERPGSVPMQQRVRAPAEPRERPVVNFAVPMPEPGTVPLTISIEPLDGDVRPENDRRALSIQVSGDKAAVLLVDGEARWEFRYLRNALARDPQVQLDAVVFHQPETTGVSTRTTYRTALFPPTEPGAKPDSTSRATDPFGDYDVIIIGDTDPADLTPEIWVRLESYVAERGGTLILGPGPRFWSSLASHEIARKLLPVVGPRPVVIDPGQSRAAFPSLPPGAALMPTLTASTNPTAWPMLQFGSDPEQSRLLWATLPPLPWALTGKPKPGATPLALALAEGANAEAQSTAVIAAQAYGLGKVLWVGTDGTWRWRYRVGDTYHHRFWGQAVRWGASGKLAAGNAYVRFGPVPPQVIEGEMPRFQARIAQGIPGVGPDLLLAARVFKAGATSNEPAGDAVAVVPLRPVAGQPRAYEGQGPALPRGRYVIRLDVPQLADVLHLSESQNDRETKTAPQAVLDVVERETSELIELNVDRELATRLATATGGRVLADHEANRIPSLLHARTSQAVRTVETPLWDHPAALLLFFTIVISEWILRKHVGLP